MAMDPILYMTFETMARAHCCRICHVAVCAGFRLYRWKHFQLQRSYTMDGETQCSVCRGRGSFESQLTGSKPAVRMLVDRAAAQRNPGNVIRLYEPVVALARTRPCSYRLICKNSWPEYGAWARDGVALEYPHQTTLVCRRRNPKVSPGATAPVTLKP